MARLIQSKFILIACATLITLISVSFAFQIRSRPVQIRYVPVVFIDQFATVPSPTLTTTPTPVHVQHHNNHSESNTEYIDLSYTYDNDTIFFPAQRFDFNLLHDVGPTINTTKVGNYRYSYASWSICMSEHGGTHMDAPFHFNKFGWRLSEVPLERLINIKLTVIDVERLVFAMERPEEFALEVEHIVDHESKFGKISNGSVVMINFGWEKYWPDKIRFLGWRNSTAGGNATMNFPGVARNAARWLLRERQIIGLGVDTLSPDSGNSADPIVHITLLESQVYILENVANLRYLLQRTRPNSYHHSNKNCNDLRLIVQPVKTMGTAGPVRLVAYCTSWQSGDLYGPQ